MFETLDNAIKNNLPLNTKIKYTCENCKLEYVHKYSTIKNRKVNSNEPICNNCLNNLYSYKLKVNLPYELQQLEDSPIPWEMYLRYKDKYNKGCKKWIQIECTECKELKFVQWRKIANRTYSKDMPVCNDCIQKFKANLPEVRKINSEAQKIAQNKPGMKEKMSEIIKDKIKNDLKFRDKITRYSQKLCGYYNGIRFDSSWELSLIYLYGDNIKRSELAIPYIWENKEHLYLPDFELIENGKKYLVEVKGEYRERDLVKINTAKQLIKDKKLNFEDMKIIDKTNIYNLEGIVFFNNMKALNIFSKDELKIINYPKGWIKGDGINESGIYR